MSEFESSTTKVSDPEQRVRSLFKSEHVPFPEVLVSDRYRPHLRRAYEAQVDPKEYVTWIDRERRRLEELQRLGAARRQPVEAPSEVEPAPSPFLARRPDLQFRYDNPEVTRSLIAERFVTKRKPRRTLDEIIRWISEPRDVPLTLTDANLEFLDRRFDIMDLLYDALAAMPRPGVSNVEWETRLRLETKQLRKQHPEIADMPDLLARSVAHTVAWKRELLHRLSYGPNVKLLREHGRNYAFQFPDGLGTVEFAPSGNEAFDSWLVSTAFVVKTAAIWFTKEQFKPRATFQFLDLDVVGIANKSLARIKGSKLPTEVLRAALKSKYKIKLHDREIAQFMSAATGWHGPKQLRYDDGRVQGYELLI
jgi:hypothetical protein